LHCWFFPTVGWSYSSRYCHEDGGLLHLGSWRSVFAIMSIMKILNTDIDIIQVSSATMSKRHSHLKVAQVLWYFKNFISPLHMYSLVIILMPSLARRDH
jgi:hypothetical protein